MTVHFGGACASHFREDLDMVTPFQAVRFPLPKVDTVPRFLADMANVGARIPLSVVVDSQDHSHQDTMVRKCEIARHVNEAQSAVRMQM
jgi:hypothetical protein